MTKKEMAESVLQMTENQYVNSVAFYKGLEKHSKSWVEMIYNKVVKENLPPDQGVYFMTGVAVRNR